VVPRNIPPLLSERIAGAFLIYKNTKERELIL